MIVEENINKFYDLFMKSLNEVDFKYRNISKVDFEKYLRFLINHTNEWSSFINTYEVKDTDKNKSFLIPFLESYLINYNKNSKSSSTSVIKSQNVVNNGEIYNIETKKKNNEKLKENEPNKYETPNNQSKYNQTSPNTKSSNQSSFSSKTIPTTSNPTSQNTPSVSTPKPQEQTKQTHPNTTTISPTQLPSPTPVSKSESSQKPQQSITKQPPGQDSSKTGNKSSESQIPPQSKQGTGSTVPPKVDTNPNLINMPNGIENQSYEYKYPKQSGKKYNHSSNFEFILVGLNITDDDNFIYIKGDKLKNPGNYTFEITEKGNTEKITLKLFINKDPKSLWNVLEPDPKEKAIFDKPHYHAELQETQMFRIVGASLRGRSHAHEGKFREDDFKIHLEPDGIVVVAVSDGAGSAKYSRIGSYHVCEEGVKHVVKHFNDKRSELEPLLEAYAEGKLIDSEKQKLRSIPQILIESGIYVSKYLNETLPALYKAKYPDLKFQSKDFSATYLIGILIPMKGKYILCTFWAGDGGIGYLNRETNKVECLGIPDGGEFSGQTLFVNSSSVFANNEYLYSTRVQFRLLDEFTAIFLMSDGITDPKFGTDSELKNLEKWKSLWSELESHIYSTNPKENLQDWLGFWSQGNYDDRTFISISKKR